MLISDGVEGHVHRDSKEHLRRVRSSHFGLRSSHFGVILRRVGVPYRGGQNRASNLRTRSGPFARATDLCTHLCI